MLFARKNVLYAQCDITRAEAWQLHKAVNTAKLHYPLAKGNLCRHRDRNPTGGA